MVRGNLDPIGDHTQQHQSEDFPNATVIPAAEHNKKGKSDSMQLVQVEMDEGKSTVYGHGLYLGLASGRMQGESEDDIIREAATITAQVRKNKLSYSEALTSTRANHQSEMLVKPLTTGLPVAVRAESAAANPAEAGSVDLSSLRIPNVRVTYEGSFGVIRTRYHSAELSGDFLVLIFDKRCKVVDMYAPPTSGELLKVSVGEGEQQQEYYVQPLGVNLDLDVRTINRYIVVLPIVPSDHEMVLEHLGEDGPPIEGDLMPDTPPGMPSLGASSARAPGQTTL